MTERASRRCRDGYVSFTGGCLKDRGFALIRSFLLADTGDARPPIWIRSTILLHSKSVRIAGSFSRRQRLFQESIGERDESERERNLPAWTSRLALMDEEIGVLPPLRILPSPGLSAEAYVAAVCVELDVEIGGVVLMESVDPSPALNFDITPWITYLTGLAGALTPKILDGAIGEIGAEGLRRVARIVGYVRRRPGSKPSTVVIVQVPGGVLRTYNIPAIDAAEAVEDILRDVGLADVDEHPLDRARFWLEGEWFGGETWRLRQATRPPFNGSSTTAMPRAETFAALEALRKIFRSEMTYASCGADIAISIPDGANVEATEDALVALRAHMPDRPIGLDADRHTICVANALSRWPDA